MSRWRRLAAVVLAIALAGAACRPAEDRGDGGDAASPRGTPQGFPITLTDDEGAEVTLDAEPTRIVTFAPSHTETLFALGLGDRVVGVSGPFDDYPPEAAAIEAIGGEGGVEPSVEKVVALEPDLLLTAFIGGEWKARLRDLGVPVFTTLASSFDDTLADIETVGRLTGAEEEAAALIDDLREEARSVTERLEGTEPVSCFLELSDLFTVGPGSLEYDLLRRAGCLPVTAQAAEPYPQWSVEQLVRDDPDVFLASEFGQDLQAVTDRPGVRQLRAVEQERVHLVSGDLISRPGPRLSEGVRALAEILHPELF